MVCQEGPCHQAFSRWVQLHLIFEVESPLFWFFHGVAIKPAYRFTCCVQGSWFCVHAGTVGSALILFGSCSLHSADRTFGSKHHRRSVCAGLSSAVNRQPWPFSLMEKSKCAAPTVNQYHVDKLPTPVCVELTSKMGHKISTLPRLHSITRSTREATKPCLIMWSCW